MKTTMDQAVDDNLQLCGIQDSQTGMWWHHQKSQTRANCYGWTEKICSVWTPQGVMRELQNVIRKSKIVPSRLLIMTLEGAGPIAYQQQTEQEKQPEEVDWSKPIRWKDEEAYQKGDSVSHVCTIIPPTNDGLTQLLRAGDSFFAVDEYGMRPGHGSGVINLPPPKKKLRIGLAWHPEKGSAVFVLHDDGSVSLKPGSKSYSTPFPNLFQAEKYGWHILIPATPCEIPGSQRS